MRRSKQLCDVLIQKANATFCAQRTNSSSSTCLAGLGLLCFPKGVLPPQTYTHTSSPAFKMPTQKIPIEARFEGRVVRFDFNFRIGSTKRLYVRMLIDLISDELNSPVSSVEYVNANNQRVIIDNDVLLGTAISTSARDVLTLFVKVQDVQSNTQQNRPSADDIGITAIPSKIDVGAENVHSLTNPEDEITHNDDGFVEIKNENDNHRSDGVVASNSIVLADGGNDGFVSEAQDETNDRSRGHIIETSTPSAATDRPFPATSDGEDQKQQIEVMQRRLSDLNYLNFSEMLDEVGDYGLDTVVAVFHFRLAHNEDLLLGAEECMNFDIRIANAVEKVWRFETRS